MIIAVFLVASFVLVAVVSFCVYYGEWCIERIGACKARAIEWCMARRVVPSRRGSADSRRTGRHVELALPL